VQPTNVLGQKEIRMEFTSANLAQELFTKMPRFLLVLVEKLPVAEAQ
jgi:hypothetical protein